MSPAHSTFVLALVWCSLSAKPVCAQRSGLEFGSAAAIGLTITQLRITQAAATDLRPQYTSFESLGNVGFYLGTLPYQGWGWRGEASFGFMTTAGTTFDFTESDAPTRVLNLGLEVQHTDANWVSYGVGVDYADTEYSVVLDHPRSAENYKLEPVPYFGVHGLIAYHDPTYSLTFRLDLLSHFTHAEVRPLPFEARGTPVGRFTEWRFGPSMRLSLPFNRLAWLGRLESSRTIYSPRL